MNGLEALKKLPKWLDDEHRDSEEKYFKASEEYKAIEKELKALKIIKRKRLDLYYFKNDITYDEYLKHFNGVAREMVNNGEYVYFVATKDEFDLLKEVLQ